LTGLSWADKSLLDLPYDLLYNSFSHSTWKRHIAAYKNFIRFEFYCKKKLPWPIDSNLANDYCNWALTIAKLSPATVKVYMESLATIHKLKNFDDSGFKNYIAKCLIRAAENVKSHEASNLNTRIVMTLPLLKLIGDRIARSDWSEHNKQTIWTACVIAFFGSFRMGELLSPFEKTFDFKATLLWKDIKFYRNSAIVHIKMPKSRNPKGEFVDLFEFSGHNCCPIRTLEQLKKISGGIEKNPVFVLENGNFLTKSYLNKILQNILSNPLGYKANFVYSHSFRAGIPSLLAKNPNLASDKHVLGWGRWCSDAYMSYTRLKHDQKNILFEKIRQLLYKRN